MDFSNTAVLSVPSAADVPLPHLAFYPICVRLWIGVLLNVASGNVLTRAERGFRNTGGRTRSETLGTRNGPDPSFHADVSDVEITHHHANDVTTPEGPALVGEPSGVNTAGAVEVPRREVVTDLLDIAGRDPPPFRIQNIGRTSFASDPRSLLRIQDLVAKVEGGPAGRNAETSDLDAILPRRIIRRRWDRRGGILRGGGA